jgi:hypothetical protein
VIKVPSWVKRPLGKYYMYFAHHRGTYIRLAYADSLHGPWKVYVPGVLNVSATALYRPQPDPPYEIYGVYTHVASPEVLVDDANKRLVMWVHGQFSDGKKWPEDPVEAHAWLQRNGYSQVTQVTVSTDGLHFKAEPSSTTANITASCASDGWFVQPTCSSRSRTARIRSATRRSATRSGTSRCSPKARHCTSFSR